MLAAKIDEFGWGGWVVAAVLAIVAMHVFWPVALVAVGCIAFSRMRRHRRGPGQWHNTGDERWGGCGRGKWNRQVPSSGNAAFDEYRAETLRRLEEEQHQFRDYLERLRRAKDKAEFDQFMADRRNTPMAPEAPDA